MSLYVCLAYSSEAGGATIVRAGYQIRQPQGNACSFVPLLSASEAAGGGVPVFHSLLESRKGL